MTDRHPQPPRAQDARPVDDPFDLRTVPTDALFREIRRRCRGRPGPGVARLGDLSVDVGAGVAVWRGRVVRLQPREVEVLCALMAEHPHGLTRSEIARRIWDDAASAGAAYYTSALRSKLPGLIPKLSPQSYNPGRYRLVVTLAAATHPAEVA